MQSKRHTRNAKPSIVIIDSDRVMARALKYNLERESYGVSVAHDGSEGLRKARALLPALVITEVVLPGIDGLDVCRELRADARTRELLVLILTAKAEEADHLAGFSVGADDYVTKPFSMKVFLQKVKALVRRATGVAESTEQIEHLGLRIDRERHRVTYGESEFALTLTEFRLLECLLRRPGHVFSRPQLVHAAIGERTTVSDRTIDIHIAMLRRKLSPMNLIETVRGVGYRLRDTSIHI